MAQREHFSGRVAVVCAMAGSAIGLGNIWRFPYMVGEHGGAAFVIIYIAATLLVSLPVFIAEVSLGRMSRCSAVGSMSKLRPGKKFWKGAGFLPFIIPLLIASYYSVIGGWALGFLFKSISGQMVSTAPEAAEGLFAQFQATGIQPITMHLLFLAGCSLILVFGVRSGIEKFSKLSLPVLFFLIVSMAVYSLNLPGSDGGVRYLLRPDFSQVGPSTFAYALGQSFYSLSLGTGAIITYGSYVRREENITSSCIGTAVCDLLFAVLAGFAIMPAVFAAGIEPSAGSGLIFQSIPYIFSSIGSAVPALGVVMSIVFFLTVVVAAMTSQISQMQVLLDVLQEKTGIGRRKGCLILFVVLGGLGCICALRTDILEGCDFLCCNVLLLIFSFLIMVFTGFVLGKERVREEITNSGIIRFPEKLFDVVFFLIKWVAPAAIALIFISNFIL